MRRLKCCNTDTKRCCPISCDCCCCCRCCLRGVATWWLNGAGLQLGSAGSGAFIKLVASLRWWTIWSHLQRSDFNKDREKEMISSFGTHTRRLIYNKFKARQCSSYNRCNTVPTVLIVNYASRESSPIAFNIVQQWLRKGHTIGLRIDIWKLSQVTRSNWLNLRL